MTIPVNLTADLGTMYSPVLSIYFEGDTPDITLTSGDTIALGQGASSLDISLVGKSTTQVVSAITKGGLQYQARVLLEVTDLGAVTLTMTTGDTTADGAQIIRVQGHVAQRLEETQIRILQPYNDSRYDPWYIVINRGWVSRRFAGGDWKFAVPEYSKQTWSARYGTGFVDIQDVIVERLGHRAIGVARAPIHWDRSNITLKVRGIVQPSSTIRDVDVNNGVIYLNKDFDEDDIILVDYTYKEDGYIYPGVDLNPTEFHNPSVLNRYVIFFLLPYIDPYGKVRDRCVRHVVAPTLLGGLQQVRRRFARISLDRPKKGRSSMGPIMILGAIQVRAVHDVSDVEVTDTRTRGGGVKWEKYEDALTRNREILSTADRGFYDGRPYAGNMALFIRLPDAIRTTFSEAERNGIIKKFTAFGTYTIVEFEE